MIHLRADFDLWLWTLHWRSLRIPMEKILPVTCWKIEPVAVALYRQWTYPDPHLMQHCVAECKSYYRRPFHQRLLPLEVHLPPFLARHSLFFVLFLGASLCFSGLAAAESVKCCSLWGLSPTGSRSKLQRSVQTHSIHTSSVCCQSNDIDSGKKEKNLSRFPPSNFNVYISF